jgi:hypothetical protein
VIGEAFPLKKWLNISYPPRPWFSCPTPPVQIYFLQHESGVDAAAKEYAIKFWKITKTSYKQAVAVN